MLKHNFLFSCIIPFFPPSFSSISTFAYYDSKFSDFKFLFFLLSFINILRVLLLDCLLCVWDMKHEQTWVYFPVEGTLKDPNIRLRPGSLRISLYLYGQEGEPWPTFSRYPQAQWPIMPNMTKSRNNLSPDLSPGSSSISSIGKSLEARSWDG